MNGADSGRFAPSSSVILLDESLSALNAALRRCVRPDTGLWDAQDGRSTPDDHYGQLGAALALLVGEDGGDTLWRLPFDAWCALSSQRTGHAPFNRFLLLLIVEVLRAGGAPTHEWSPVSRMLPRCRLARAYPSNNWSLLAQLCRLMDAPTDARRARFVAMLERWTTPAGGFIDYPARPSGRAGATPLAYHHKALFVATVAASRIDDNALNAQLQRLLDWTLLGWDGWSHAGGFGRSTHALFGDACLLASLVLLGFAEPSREETPGGRMLRGILLRWREQRREDGLLSLNPAGREDARAGWDDYMHLSVYNAWAAAIVGWARHQAPSSPPVSALVLPAAVGIVREDAGAGLLRVASAADDGVVLVSTRGQPPQSFGFTRADFRYAGAVPYHLAWRGRVLCPPPVQVEGVALLDDPCLAGWTPIFLIGDRLYGLTDFSTVTVEALPEMQGRRVTLSGRPVQLLRAPAQGILRRFVSALDWRFCDGALLRRRAALRREQADEIEARVVITIVPAVPRLECIVAVDYRGGRPARWLNPCGHALVAAEPFVRRCRLRDADASTDAARELRSRPLPSSVPGGVGYCLPALELTPGAVEADVALEWSLS